MDPREPTTHPEAPPARSAGGLRRTLATAALALGLLTVGGTAVVLAASPDPGTSAAPAATDPATDGTSGTATDGTTAPSTERGPRGHLAADGTKPDCPEGAGPADDGTTDDGTTGDDAAPETTDPTTEPTPDPTQTPTQEPSPTATPAV